MEPITRKEMYLAKAGGQDVPLPEPVTREEMFLAKIAQGGGSSVQPDLSQNDPTQPDYVKNRTHYESVEIVNEPLNITWDGNTEGLTHVETEDGENFYKISNAVLTDEQIKSATFVVSLGFTEAIADMWDDLVADGIVTNDIVECMTLLFVRKEGVMYGGVSCPECGIYSINVNNELYVSSLTTAEPVEHTKTVVHKLDKKFLPDDVGNTFQVNVFCDEAKSDWASDKTYDEIKAAEESKMPIVGTFTNLDGNVFTIVGCDSANAECCYLSAFNVAKYGEPLIYKITIAEGGIVYVSELALSATETEVYVSQ